MAALDFSSRATTKSGPLDFTDQAEPTDPRKAKALADARVRTQNSGPDAIRSVASGASLGLSDEIDALGAAAETGVHNLFNKATGQGDVGYTAGDAFHAVMQANKERSADFHAAHPIADTSLQIGSGLLTPGLGAAGEFIGGAKSLGGAAVRSAGVGGLIGSVAGAGNADGGLIDRAKGSAAGLIAGGLVGAAAPVAVRGAVGLINRGGAAVSEAASSASRALGRPEPVQTLTPQAAQSAKDRALAYVTDMVARSGKSVDELVSHPAEAMGKPVTAAEAIGRTGQYQLQTLGKRSGTTPDALEGMLEARRLDAPNRITADISDTLGVHPEAAKGSIDTLVERGQAAAKPLYDSALSGTDPVTTPTLEKLTNRPVIQKALKSVAQQILNAGEDPMAHGLEVTGMMDNGLPQAVTMKAPTAKTWDMVKKAVANQVERHPITNKPLPDSISEGNRGVTVASKDLTAALRDAIPDYGKALDTAGDYLSHQSAFERVKGAVFKTQLTHGDFAKMWTGFSPSQQEAARAAIANDFHNLAQNGRLNPRLFNTQSVRNKLTTAFGPERTNALIARIEQEALLAKGQRMTPGTNSTTGESAFTGDEQGSEMGLIAAKGIGKALMGDGHGAARDLGRTAIEGLLAPVRGARTPLAQASRDEVGRLLQLKPSELAAELRQFQTRAPKVVRRGSSVAPVAASRAGGYAGSVVNNP